MAGRSKTVDRLIPEAYEDLRQIARSLLFGERDLIELSSSGLVHEAYMRLVALSAMEFVDRAHFLATASRFMRRVLIDHARARTRQRRGGELRRVPLRQDMLPTTDDLDSLLCLEEALGALGADHPRRCRVVEARFFLGLTITETAEVLGVSTTTVKRDWRVAREHLNRMLDACAGP